MIDMPQIGDSVPVEFVVKKDREAAQEMLENIANAQAAARFAEKIARSERKQGKVKIQKFSDRTVSGEVNWDKQESIPVGKNTMSELMNGIIPSRGQTLAHTAKSKANKAKRK